MGRDDTHPPNPRPDQVALELLRRAWPGAPAAGSGRAERRPGAAPERVGPFRVKRELGRGGFGVVYLAEGPAAGREVALKVPHAGALADPRHLQRFVWEGEAAAALAHENIVRVYEAGQDDEVPYLALELCPGPTLAAWLAARQGAPVPPREAAGLVATLAEAVHFIHRRGILHRDLKPGNVLLAPRPAAATGGTPVPPEPAGALAGYVPKVTDFGLARDDRRDAGPTGGRTQTGAALGTPRYMAPEQVRGRPGEVGTHSDVWALGVILYELLTGRNPFADGTDAEARQEVLSPTPVPPPRLAAGRLPRDLETVCLKCLEKEPARRYGSAEALADDLRRWLAGEPIHARPLGRAERLWRWCRANPAVAALAGALAAAVVVGAVTVTALWQRAEWHRRQAESDRDLARQETARAEENYRRLRDSEGRYQDLESSFRDAGQSLTRLGQQKWAGVPQLEAARREALELALQVQLKLARSGGQSPADRWQAGQAYLRVGDVRALLGKAAEAEAAYREAVALLGGLPADYPDRAARVGSLARGHSRLGDLLAAQDRFAEAEQAYREVEAALAALPEGVRGEPNRRRDLAAFTVNRAVRLVQARRFAEAEAPARRGVALLRELAHDLPGHPQLAGDLANGCNMLGILLKNTRRPGEARAAYEEAAGLWEKAVARAPDDAGLRLQLGVTYRNLAILLREPGGAEEERAFTRAEEVLRRLAEDFPAVPRHHHQLGEAYHSWGLAALGRNDPAGALAKFEKAAEHQQRALTLAPKAPAHRRALCKHCYYLARLRVDRADHRGAAQAAVTMASVGDRWIDFYNPACFLVTCAALARKAPDLPEAAREELAEGHLRQAVAVLRHARSSSHIEPRQVRNDPAFAPLRARPDFQALLAELTAKAG